jgi:UbiD family decarboxylase
MIGATRESFSRQWMAAESNPFKPVEVSNGPVRGVIQTGEEVDIYSLPLAQHFSDDAGPYISSGIAVARDPDTGVYYLLRAPEG